MMNYFMVWLTNERRLALFPGCTIVRDPHHLESLTSCKQDWNQSSDFVEWSCAVVITITPQRHWVNIKFTCNFAAIEWVPGWFSRLRIISSTSLMFASVRTVLGFLEPSFRAMPPVSSIFFSSFLTPFAFRSYSAWLLTVHVALYLYFIRRYLMLTFSAFENAMSLVTNNLI